MAEQFDEDALQKYLKRMNVDQTNQMGMQELDQGMHSVTPTSNPYGGGGEQKKSGFFGTVGKIAAPVMKLGGMALSAAGMPYVGIPLSVAGSAVGGAGNGGGITGALTGGLKSGVSQGLGAGMDFMKGPGAGGDPIDIASKGLTIPGKRQNEIDMGGYTIPANASEGGS